MIPFPRPEQRNWLPSAVSLLAAFVNQRHNEILSLKAFNLGLVTNEIEFSLLLAPSYAYHELFQVVPELS